MRKIEFIKPNMELDEEFASDKKYLKIKISVYKCLFLKIY